MDYPTWICRDCGLRYGCAASNAATTWHTETCDICGIKKAVTEPRDFGHLSKKSLDFLGIKV